MSLSVAMAGHTSMGLPQISSERMGEKRSLHQSNEVLMRCEPVCNDFLVDKEVERVTNEMHVERIVF